jgi:hypothetical protein
MHLVPLLVTLLLFASTANAAAAPVRGDLLVSGGLFCLCGFTFPEFRVYSPDGAFKSNESIGTGNDILVDIDGSLLISSAAGPISRYSPELQPIGTIGPSVSSQVMAMDRDGNLLAISSLGDLRTWSRSGILLATNHLPVSPGEKVTAADLSPDQCTLHYFAQSLSRRTIRRFDLCMNTELPDLAQKVAYVDDVASLRFAREAASILLVAR